MQVPWTLVTLSGQNDDSVVVIEKKKNPKVRGELLLFSYERFVKRILRYIIDDALCARSRRSALVNFAYVSTFNRRFTICVSIEVRRNKGNKRY